MTQLVGPLNSGLAVGADNAAVANQDSVGEIIGNVAGVYVKYTLDYAGDDLNLVIATKGGGGHPPAQTILSLAALGTDGWFYPRVQICETDGTPIADSWEEIPVYDKVNVSITSAYAGDNVDVWLLVE
jgi:hypothetical protein